MPSASVVLFAMSCGLAVLAIVVGAALGILAHWFVEWLIDKTSNEKG